MEVIKQGKKVLMKANYEIEQQNEHECEVCGCVYGFYDDECNIVMTRQITPFFSQEFVRYEKHILYKEYHTCCPNCQEEIIWKIEYPKTTYFKEKKGSEDEWEEVDALTGGKIFRDYLRDRKERKERYGI